jgi:multimeric flavodoxin WrbA
MKRIYIITASPRKGANSDSMAELAAEQLRNKGAEVEIFNVREKKFAGCFGCDACKKTDVCVQKDDASAIIDKLKSCNCDGLLLISPVYFMQVPGPLKLLLDRFYVLFNPAKGTPAQSEQKKYAAIFTFGGAPESVVQGIGEWTLFPVGLAGFGSHRFLLCGNENPRDSFKNSEASQRKVKELADWLVE